MLSVLDENVPREEVLSCFVGWIFSRFMDRLLFGSVGWRQISEKTCFINFVRDLYSLPQLAQGIIRRGGFWYLSSSILPLKAISAAFGRKV